jgi:hypothetical protein
LLQGPPAGVPVQEWEQAIFDARILFQDWAQRLIFASVGLIIGTGGDALVEECGEPGSRAARSSQLRANG